MTIENCDTIYRGFANARKFYVEFSTYYEQTTIV